MKIYNLAQVASLLGIHPETARQYAVTGKLPAIKIGHSWRFVEEDIVSFMRSKYATRDVSQGVNIRRNNLWHSTNVVKRGGLTFNTTVSEYEEALGL